MQSVLQSIMTKKNHSYSRTGRADHQMIALINQSKSSKVGGTNKPMDALSIMSWAESQQKLDLMSKTSNNVKRFSFASSVKLDPRETYLQQRMGTYKAVQTV